MELSNEENLINAILNYNITFIRLLLNTYSYLIDAPLNTFMDTPLLFTTSILLHEYNNLFIRNNIKIIIKILLEYNPNMNIRNNIGNTAIFNIIDIYNEINIIDDFISHGADINLYNNDNRSIFSYYLTQITISHNHTNVLTSLLKAGLIIDIQYIPENIIPNLDLISHLI